jgi:hypothetical protein
MLQIKLASRYAFAVTQEYLVGYRQRNRQQSINADRRYQSWVRTLNLVREECERVPGRAIAWKLAELAVSALSRDCCDSLIPATAVAKLGVDDSPLWG